MRIIPILIFLAACTTSSETRKNLNEVYQGAGVVQYFLSQLPAWANYSSIGQCYRSGNVRFFDFKNLHASYALDYEQALALQYMYNRNLQKSSLELGNKIFNTEDESFIFYNSYEQIIGGGRQFLVPTFDRVHVIWIDDILNHPAKLSRLKRLMDSAEMEKGHPVFMSMCKSYDDMESFVARTGFDTYGVKFISMEMFAPYNRNFEPLPFEDIDLNEVMPGKKVYLYVPYIPVQFKNKNNIQKY